MSDASIAPKEAMPAAATTVPFLAVRAAMVSSPSKIAVKEDATAPLAPAFTSAAVVVPSAAKKVLVAVAAAPLTTL